MTERDPFEEGIEAHADGIPRSDCPYREGSEERVEWLRGWDEASQESGDKEPWEVR
ncbi:ribosome modulation factor [Methylobacterium nigriterrae]|uniref:ribosome modulation factor n=1 Tax=Methylobacterium nigriterrae TaxID=3127512 RepID=UPI0030136B91